MKKLITILLLLFLSGCSQLIGFTPESLKLKAPKDKILYHREIQVKYPQNLLGAGTSTDAIIKTEVEYYYISDEKTNKQYQFRGEFSNAEIVKSEPGKMETKNYFGDVVFKDTSNNTFLIKSATTTPEAYAEQTKLILWERIFGRKVLATNYNVGTGCGYLRANAKTTFALAHDATSADTISVNPASPGVDGEGASLKSFDAPDYYYLRRAFLPIDLSAQGTGWTASAATLYAWQYASGVTGGSYDYASVIQTSQASPTTLVANDYDNVGTTKGATDHTISTGDDNSWTSWSLNATGLTWLDPTGYAYLGLRQGNDIMNVDIGTPVKVSWQAIHWQASATNQPYITITWTAVGGTSVPDDDYKIYEEN